MKNENDIMFQYFEWNMKVKEGLWNKIIKEAGDLKELGIDSVWLPPAYKGMLGKDEVGYGVYDVYDLGEFYQHGTIPTKYGTKDEYLRAIEALKQNGIEVYTDIVLNHKIGADKTEEVWARKCDWEDRTKEGPLQKITANTIFNFPGRADKYSNFKWNWTHFDGIDIDKKTGEHAIFKFKNKQWEKNVDDENVNYDFLIGADVDFSNPEVVEECKSWGVWYQNITRANGFRLDAVKHIEASFYKEWLEYVRKQTGKELFSFGEYWTVDVYKLHKYLKEVNDSMSLFDVPLHYNLYKASKEANFNMSKILENTLVKERPEKAITFVDNHDTQPGQSIESFISSWMKQLAYSIILLRKDGYPCVFYGDLYGIEYSKVKPVEKLKTIMAIRKLKAYGRQYDYFDNPNIIGWTREGDNMHKNSGLAVLASNSFDGQKRMYIGTSFAGEIFIDVLGNCKEEVTIDNSGYGVFKTKGKSCSVWVKK